MAASKAAVKLSEQWQGGVFKCYRKMIGGRAFFLSSDRGESERMALALSAAWGQLAAAGKGWTEEAVAAALAVAGVVPKSGRVAVGSQRVHAAVDDYLAEYKGTGSRPADTCVTLRHLRNTSACKRTCRCGS